MYLIDSNYYFCTRRKQNELLNIVNRSQIVNINEDIWQLYCYGWADRARLQSRPDRLVPMSCPDRKYC